MAKKRGPGSAFIYTTPSINQIEEKHSLRNLKSHGTFFTKSFYI